MVKNSSNSWREEVTRDPKAFKKAQGQELIDSLDAIVPKPVSLMNISRTALREGGRNSWSANFQLDGSLEKVRVSHPLPQAP